MRSSQLEFDVCRKRDSKTLFSSSINPETNQCLLSSGGKRRIMCTLSSLDKFELKSFYFVNENFNTYNTNNLKYMGNNVGDSL